MIKFTEYDTKKFTLKFKAKVVLEALNEQYTPNEIAGSSFYSNRRMEEQFP